MLGSMFVVGITGPTSLVVIAIIALYSDQRNYHNLVEQSVQL